MASEQERQNYIWRPNDNSATTRVRYELEAEHWYRSFRAAERKSKSTSLRNDLSSVGLFLQLTFSLLSIVLLSIIGFVKWLRSLGEQNK